MNKSFWKWYEKRLHLNRTIVAVLFGWQLLHLYWLTTHVVGEKLFGYPLFSPSEFYELLLIFADYAEIPALISGTLLYIYSLREGSIKKNLIFILLINSQWLHLFWITDEFVIDTFGEKTTILPVWLAWVAIFIDYLELPVIFDALRSVMKSSLTKISKRLDGVPLK